MGNRYAPALLPVHPCRPDRSLAAGLAGRASAKQRSPSTAATLASGRTNRPTAPRGLIGARRRHCTCSASWHAEQDGRWSRPVLGEAIVHDAGDAGLHCELGFAMLDQQRLPEATRVLSSSCSAKSKIRRRVAESGRNARSVGTVRSGACRPPRRAAAAVLPDNKFAHFNLGNVLRAAGTA